MKGREDGIDLQKITNGPDIFYSLLSFPYLAREYLPRWFNYPWKARKWDLIFNIVYFLPHSISMMIVTKKHLWPVKSKRPLCKHYSEQISWFVTNFLEYIPSMCCMWSLPMTSKDLERQHPPWSLGANSRD